MMAPVTMMNSLTILLLVLFLHESVAFTACSSRAAVNSHLFIAPVSSKHKSWQHSPLSRVDNNNNNNNISLHRNAVKSTRKRFKDLKSNIVALKSSKRDDEESRRDVFSSLIAARPRIIMRWIASFRKVIKPLLMATFFAFFMFVNSAYAGGSGGRMGGSFSPSSSRSSSGGGGGGSSIHRSSPSRGYSSGSSSMRMRGYSPGIRVYAPSYRLGPSYYPSPSHLFHSRTCDAHPARRFGVADAIVLGGTGYILYTAFVKPRNGSDRRNPLGEGASVASITLALSVPDRDDFYSILNKLKRLAESSDTSTRSGVQTLVSNVALELLREESAITSAKTTSSHFRSTNQADREFQRISVQERSKFDKETVNKFGGIDISQRDAVIDNTTNDKATEAVVTISLAIEGDQTELPEIRSREDLKYALTRIAADAPVEDCLLSAEVLWAPELRSERLTQNDVYSDHPDLYPL
jgi:hypothetical protein